MSSFTGVDLPYNGNHLRKKVLQITFFAIVHEKTFMIQVISYIKLLAKIKSAKKHSQNLPDSRNLQNFSSMDNSHYTAYEKFGDGDT